MRTGRAGTRWASPGVGEGAAGGRGALGDRRCRSTLANLTLRAALLATAATEVAAQGDVTGTVQDRFGRPIAGAQVRLLGDERVAESDGRGAFRLVGVAARDGRVEVRRIGFRPETLSVRDAPVGTDGPGRTVSVVLDRVGYVLDPVFVNGRRDLTGPLAGFYRRMSQGQGRFFTQEQIEARNARRMSDFFRGIPGLRVDQRRGGASAYRIRGAQVNPIVWLDGMPLGGGEVDLEAYDPRTFAAIEIYSGSATVPPEFTTGRSLSSSGGIIVLWTRQGQQGTRRRRPGEPSPAQVLAQLIARREAWPIDSVDAPASLLGGGPLVPIYPDSLFAVAAGGQVEVEFVVGADGRPRMETFGAVSSSHPSLVEAVRRAVEGRAFLPATRGGQPVPMLLQVPFAFIPDSSTVRKPQD